MWKIVCVQIFLKLETIPNVDCFGGDNYIIGACLLTSPPQCKSLMSLSISTGNVCQKNKFWVEKFFGLKNFWVEIFFGQNI